MKAKRGMIILLIVFLSVVFCLAGYEEKKTDEKPDIKTKKSLIRKDLLTIKKDAPKRPRRNIFSPRGEAISEEDVATLISSRDFEEQESSAEEETPFFTMSLRYIGYIDAGERIVALIIYEGEAMAVEEGEMINEQFKVGKVTRDKLDIIGPGEEIKEFPLEGESG